MAEIDIENEIREHRKKIGKHVIAGVLAVVALVTVVLLWQSLRTFKSYEVKNRIEKDTTTAVKYQPFKDNVLMYSNDGIVCMKADGELVWNQTYEMTTPCISECEDYIIAYDKGGTSIYIMSEKGPVYTIETSVPIQSACVASQGTVAALLQQNDTSYVRIYDTKGKELVNGEFHDNEGGIPVDIAFSYDAMKLAISFVDLSEGKINSTISFYNFGSVGQNEIDNNVGTYTYEDVFIPEIEYVSKNKMLAIGDGTFYVFEGKQKPKLSKTIEVKESITSVFHNEKYVGITYENEGEELSHHIKVFDLNGNVVMENDTSIAYNSITLLRNNDICVLNDTQCELYTIHSIRKFSTEFDQTIYKVLSGEANQNYIFVFEDEIDEVRLK